MFLAQNDDQQIRSEGQAVQDTQHHGIRAKDLATLYLVEQKLLQAPGQCVLNQE